MKTLRWTTMTMMTLSMGAALAGASEAETSATAESNRRGDGVAEATARYDGDIGMARTDTRSGPITLARGLAWGFDRDGLTLSASHALSGRNGLALARNFNLSISPTGRVAVSGGRTVSRGPIRRSAGAGGLASSRHGQTTAISSAWGSTDRHGSVRTTTHSRSFKPRHVRKAGKWLRRLLRR